MNKFFLLVSIFSFLNYSCAQKKSQEKIDYDLLLDNLKYSQVLPDENFFPTGDSTYSKILKIGKVITPKLIEKISDTTNTKFKYADIFQYRVGDFCIDIIDHMYDDSEFPIRNILENEFFGGKTEFQYSVLYHKIFFTNSEEVNYKNRLKFKEIVKKHLKIDD